MLLYQRVRFRRAVRDDVLPLEQIGFVSVVDPGEITDAIDERRAHADVNALVRGQEVRGQHDWCAYRIATRSKLDGELSGFYALLLRIAWRCLNARRGAGPRRLR